MKSFVLVIVVALVSYALTACQQSPKREPQSIAYSYDVGQVKLLRAAVENGVYFIVTDAVMRDVPAKQMGDRCRKSEDSPWLEYTYETLQTFYRRPELYSRVHFIEYRRGDAPGVEVSNDLDGARHLIVSYTKLEKRKILNSLTELPCESGDFDAVGKELVMTSFEWPTQAQVAGALAALDPRARVTRLEFNPKFLLWLADRMTFFRFSQELVFEKNAVGEPLLVASFEQYAKELATNNGKLPAVEFWLREISDRSRQGHVLKFFGFKRDLQLSTGIQVDSTGSFSRKLNGYADPTYPYASYRTENGLYLYSNLKQLNNCLLDFQKQYLGSSRKPARLETDRDSFLYPGYFCTLEASSN